MRVLASKRRVVLPGVVLALSVVATGCSSSSSNDSGPKPSDGTSDILGAKTTVSGAPVKIGWNTEGRAEAIDNTADIAAAKAVVQYANEHLGGFNGRPFELSMVCENKALPATARECANKFVQSDIVGLVSAPTGTVDNVVEVTSPAGLPYFNVGATQKDITLPNTFVMTNTIGALVGGPAALAKEKGFKTATSLVIDVPAAVAPMKALGTLAFDNAGAKLNVVAVPPGTPDMTPQVQAALKAKPEMFQIVGNDTFCTSALKAMRTLNVTVPITMTSTCVGINTASQIPGGYKGTTTTTLYAPVAGTEDTKLYEAVMATYAKGTDAKASSAPGGFSAMLGFIRALKGFTGEPTRKSISAFLSKMPAPQSIPLGAGSTFQCGTKPLVIGPNVCTAYVVNASVAEDGSLTDAKAVDVSAFFKLPPK